MSIGLLEIFILGVSSLILLTMGFVLLLAIRKIKE
jgi:hypothetical protein